MPPAARGHQTLSAYISSRFDDFSRSQKDVAQYVVDHLDEVAFHTAEELARRASTSSSTVVRVSQALGFEGFPELQEAAREEYRHHHRTAATHPSGFENAAPLFSLDQTPFEQAVAADHVNVEETARKVSRSQVDHDVPHAPARAAHELALAGTRLEVDAAQRPAARPRVVVLRELLRDAVLGRDIRAERLDEESARVAVHLRFEQDEPVEASLKPLHRWGGG